MNDPHKLLNDAFKETLRERPNNRELGQILQVLSQELGFVAAELTDRGVSSDVLDDVIKKHMVRGVECQVRVCNRRGPRLVQGEKAA